MTPDQIRAAMGAITVKLENISAGAEGYSDDQITEVNELNAEFEKLSAQLDTAEKMEAMKTKASATTGRKVTPVAPVANVVVGANRATDRFGGFQSSSDFLSAVRRAGTTGDIDNRFKNVAYEKNGEDGGFLIPEDISTAIVKKLESSESLMAETNVMNISGNAMTITLDESQPWNQGIQAYWTAEGAPITESKAKFTQGSWRLHKLAALVKATDELLDDAVALESYIKNAAPAAIMYKVNSAIISGDGVGKPAGFLSSPFTVTVSKEGGQAADTIVARNIINMYSRMIPSARAGAKWYINAGAEAQLMGLKDDLGNFIYLTPGSQMNQTPYAMLLGRPVVPMMSGIPALGDAGDIVLANLSYYYMIQKAGIKQAASIHLNFDREITAFRFSMRLDGRAPFQSPVTTEFGNFQMSAFVKLEDR